MLKPLGRESEAVGSELAKADGDDGVDLIGGGGQLDADIVLGEADMETVADAALDKNRGLRSLVRAVEIDPLLLGNLVEYGVTVVPLGDGDDGLNVESAGSGAFGIGEDVELRDIDGLDESPGLLKELWRLAIDAYDDIYTDEGIGDEGFNGLDLSGIERSVVASAHEFEHGVGA